MTITEIRGVRPDLIGKLVVRDRTPEQQLFDQVMFGIDPIKFSPDLITKGAIQLWDKRINLRELDGISEQTSEYLGKPQNATLFVEFIPDVERRIGLRTRDREVLFVLNKDEETCVSQTGERIISGRREGWLRVGSEDIPPDDALVLTKMGLL